MPELVLGAREVRAGQLLLDVVRREHVRVGEAHRFFRTGRDEGNDIGRGARAPLGDPCAVAAPQLQRERFAIARDFAGEAQLGAVEQLPEVAREGFDGKLADRNLDVGLQRRRDMAAAWLLRACHALDRVDRVEQAFRDDGGRVAALGEFARDFEGLEHDRVAPELAPQRVGERDEQRDQRKREQDREDRRDVLRKPRQDLRAGALRAEAEEQRSGRALLRRAQRRSRHVDLPGAIAAAV